MSAVPHMANGVLEFGFLMFRTVCDFSRNFQNHCVEVDVCTTCFFVVPRALQLGEVCYPEKLILQVLDPYKYIEKENDSHVKSEILLQENSAC